MNVVRKSALELLAVAYWLIHAVNVVRLSREPGYYPPNVLEHARKVALSGPFPWSEILIAWLVLAVLTFGFYLIQRKIGYPMILSFLLSIGVLAAAVVFIPADVGGVSFAYVEYAVCSAFLALCGGLFVAGRRIIDRKEHIAKGA
jgi:hypothetical protein